MPEKKNHSADGTELVDLVYAVNEVAQLATNVSPPLDAAPFAEGHWQAGLALLDQASAQFSLAELHLARAIADHQRGR